MIRVELVDLGDDGRAVVWLPAIPGPGHLLDLGDRGEWTVAADAPVWRPHEGGCTVRLYLVATARKGVWGE